METSFHLLPAQSDLQRLAEQYWREAGELERRHEKDAYEAGAAIRDGELTLANLETIVRWKSERVVSYLIGNSDESIRAALGTVIAPGCATEAAVEALTSLRGIDLDMASAVLAAIFPERYAVLDYRALEALGQARHNASFYAEYNAFIRHLVDSGLIHTQPELPGSTPLHALERALWQWARNHDS
jgi:hypothetical protein